MSSPEPSRHQANDRAAGTPVPVDVLAPRALGSTGWSVTGLCVGAGELGHIPAGADKAGEERAVATARRAFAGPLTFVDTSNGYGLSEQRLGVVIRELGGAPDGVLLATKVDPKDGGPFDGRRARDSVKESLGRLGLDHLPLVHLHDPERITFEQAMSPSGPVVALQDLVREGVVGHLGVAGGPVDLLRRFAATGIFEVVLTHNRWTLLDKSAGPLFDQCAEAGLAAINAAPFGGGILAKGPAVSQNYAYRPASDALLRALNDIERACDRHGVPLAAAALQFSLRDPRITSTVVGMSRPERYDEALALATVAVPDDFWAELNELAPGPEHWLH
jgi:D-threo-aldose 1-dehydrogenase